MRSGPINLVTAGATPELFVVDFRKRFEPLDYFGLGNVAQRRVAANAARKRSNGVKKIKTADYFHGLFVRVLGTGAVTGPYHRVHEQTTITCQERPVFAFHNTQQLPIFRARIVGDIKPEQAQVARESSKMPVCHKLRGSYDL